MANIKCSESINHQRIKFQVWLNLIILNLFRRKLLVTYTDGIKNGRDETLDDE